MIVQESVDRKQKASTIQCTICKEEAGREQKIVLLGVTYGVICGECSKSFSLKDIQLVNQMLIAFGGYFGKLKDSKTNVYKVVKKLAEQYSLNEKNININQLSVSLLHKALLYGVTPQQLVQGLKLLND